MKFSVLIALYNKAPYICTTLRSVLAQTFTDFEVIVIDDGSTDGSAELAALVVDPRMRVIRQENQGVSATRNRGIDLAKGEWVSFLDADDWQHPLYLQSLVRAHEKFPSADILASDFIKVPHAPGHWPPQWPTLPKEPEIEYITDLAQRWMVGQTLSTSSVAVRTGLLRSMQPCFPVGEIFGEDLDLLFRLAERAPVALVRAPLAAYRIGVQGSLTTQHPAIGAAPYLERMRERALSGALNESQSESALWLVAQHEVGVARQAVASGKRLEGLRWLMRGRSAASGKRWWMTVAMLLLFPRNLVKSWQQWRVQRTAPTLTQHMQDKP